MYVLFQHDFVKVPLKKQAQCLNVFSSHPSPALQDKFPSVSQLFNRLNAHKNLSFVAADGLSFQPSIINNHALAQTVEEHPNISRNLLSLRRGEVSGHIYPPSRILYPICSNCQTTVATMPGRNCRHLIIVAVVVCYTVIIYRSI